MIATRMREVEVGAPGTAEAVIETLQWGVVMMQMPTVFTLIAPPNTAGVERLNRAKERLPRKNYGTVLGDMDSFYRMARRGTLPPELDSAHALEILLGAFIRITLAPQDFNSAMVRDGTAQGLLMDGAHRTLFRAVEQALSDEVEPSLVGGHRFAAPLCTSANISGHPDGSITDWERAYRFGMERDIPLVVRCQPEPGLTGSYPIFSLSRDRISIEREGPRMDKIKAALPARLFADGA